MSSFFFFQAEDGIRDGRVTGVQTCALPILLRAQPYARPPVVIVAPRHLRHLARPAQRGAPAVERRLPAAPDAVQIGRASCRERVEMSVVAASWKKEEEREMGTVVESAGQRV